MIRFTRSHNQRNFGSVQNARLHKLYGRYIGKASRASAGHDTRITNTAIYLHCSVSVECWISLSRRAPCTPARGGTTLSCAASTARHRHTTHSGWTLCRWDRTLSDSPLSLSHSIVGVSRALPALHLHARGSTSLHNRAGPRRMCEDRAVRLLQISPTRPCSAATLNASPLGCRATCVRACRVCSARARRLAFRGSRARRAESRRRAGCL